MYALRNKEYTFYIYRNSIVVGVFWVVFLSNTVIIRTVFVMAISYVNRLIRTPLLKKTTYV